MLLYRGERWLNGLIVLNNLARFGSGEQDQAVGSLTYYVRTLGVTMLPWSAALPAALWAAMRALRGVPEDRPDAPGASVATRAAALRRFALLWAAVTLALLTFSVTKSCPLYLLPVLPPLAVLLGLWLADLGEARARTTSGKTGWVTAVAGVGVMALVLGTAAIVGTGLAHSPDDLPLRQHVARRGAAQPSRSSSWRCPSRSASCCGRVGGHARP